jgi:putative metalloprotease
MKLKTALRATIISSLVLSGCSMLEGKFGKMAPADIVSVGSDVLKAATLSDEETAKLCHDVAIESDNNSKIAASNSAYATRLTKLVSPYTQEDGLKLNYKVYIDPEVNAFSLADGTIRVHSGLMDKMNDQELLSVIGHEIGHIKSGHSKARMQRAYAASAALKATRSSLSAGMGDSVGSVAGAVGTSMAAGLAAEVLTAQFSQSDETEADEYGVRFLKKHGKDPQAAVSALMKLGSEDGEESSSIMAQFTSSHPGSKDRAEHISEMIAQLGDVSEPASTQMAVDKTHDHDNQQSIQLAQVQAEPSSQKLQAAEHVQQAVQLKPAAKLAAVAQLNSIEPRAVSDADTNQVAATSGWYIQMAAFPENSAAESMRTALRERQERATVQAAIVKGNQYQRVLVGPYPTKQNASIELDRVIGHGIFDGEPFVRHLP